MNNPPFPDSPFRPAHLSLSGFLAKATEQHPSQGAPGKMLCSRVCPQIILSHLHCGFNFRWIIDRHCKESFDKLRTGSDEAVISPH